MQTQRYNGWTNYETWAVKLWMDNEEGSYYYGRDLAQEQWDESSGDTPEERTNEAVYALANILKDQYQEAMPEVTGIWADLLGAALAEVNWREIAENMIEDVDKEEETPAEDEE